MANNQTVDAGEFISALDALSKERRINKEVLFSAIEVRADHRLSRKNYGKTANVRATIDPETPARWRCSPARPCVEDRRPIPSLRDDPGRGPRHSATRYEIGDIGGSAR